MPVSGDRWSRTYSPLVGLRGSMVFFTCNACGESLKKAQVEKHVNICRGCEVLSCIDCGKDFWGNDYKNHLKCISENEKYGGKGYEAKSNKGDVKQQQWIQRIHEAMNKPGISPKLKDILSQVSSYDNVPRKKAKFQNWMKNSLKIYNTALHDQVWDIFSEATSNASAAPKPSETTHHLESTEPPSSVQAAEISGQEAQTKERKKNKRERKEERQKKKSKKKREEENGVTVKLQEGEATDNSGKQKKKRRKGDREESPLRNGEGEIKNGHAQEGDHTVPQKKKKRKRNEVDGSGEGQAENGLAVEGEDHTDSPRKKKKRKRNEVEGNGAGQAENGLAAEGESTAKKMKKSRKCPTEDNAEAVEAEGNTGDEDESAPKGKFNWKGTIKAVLKDAPEEGLPIKKLRKKVLAEYHNFSGGQNHKSEEELLALFSRKVNNNPKFRVLKEKVRLIK
ncbi:hypothetical protein GJAV_G00167870 [Gymnothorax javanicus]|nr:hypothetical protein GJAV_G00167870 [Gymnothorax javanicus]